MEDLQPESPFQASALARAARSCLCLSCTGISAETCLLWSVDQCVGYFHVHRAAHLNHLDVNLNRREEANPGPAVASAAGRAWGVY